MRNPLAFVLLLVAGLGSPLHLSAADPLVTAALAAEARHDSRTALALFKQANHAHPNDPFILQKISHQLSDATNDTTDVPEKKRLTIEALAYAERAVALAPDNPVNVLSLAICHGKLATYSDTREKIALSRLVKDEAERALALDPDYDWAHHVLGRWHREVASLGSGTRWFVKLVHGGLPPASQEKAVAHLERAAALSPKVVAHTLELAFAYQACGRHAEARTNFLKGLALPSREKHDESAKQRARAALQALPLSAAVFSGTPSAKID